MKKLKVILAIAGVLNVLSSFSQQITPQQLKSAYIFNFTKYIDWPNQENLKDFKIGFIGDDPKMLIELRKLGDEQQIKDKPITVEHTDTRANLKIYQILVIANNENRRIQNIANKTIKSGTLLISDQCPTKESIMLNFTSISGGRIGFEVNRSNIVYEGLKMSNDILLLGGTELEVATLYKNKEKELNELKEKFQQQAEIVEKQLADIQTQKQLIKEQTQKIEEQKTNIQTQLNKIENQEKRINAQDSYLKERENKLLEIQANFRKRELELIKKLEVIKEKEKEILALEDKINNGVKILESQKEKIRQQAAQINNQERTLNKQGSTIKTQQIVLMGIGVILFLVIALIIAILRSYKQKQRSNKQLETANIELEESNNTLNKTLDKLQKTQTQLVQSEKMASLGTLTAGIAHEINNPVSFVSVGAYSLKNNFEAFLSIIDEIESLEKTEQQKEVIKKIKEEQEYTDIKESITELIDDIKLGADRTTQIVKGLRNFSRLDESDYKKANIHDGIDSTLLLLRNKYHERIEIIKDYDKSVPSIDCFAGQLNQVFMNIINNAIDAIIGEGTIIIKTKKQNDTIFVHIKDTGTGMSEATKSKIFDPFYTTKEVGKGTGLGLSISFGIIKKHKGDIEVFSNLEQGTEFIIKLPISSNIQHQTGEKEV